MVTMVTRLVFYHVLALLLCRTSGVIKTNLDHHPPVSGGIQEISTQLNARCGSTKLRAMCHCEWRSFGPIGWDLQVT